MDPNQLLKDLRELAKTVYGCDENYDRFADDAAELAIGFQHLDEWLSRGGFPPADWNSKQ